MKIGILNFYDSPNYGGYLLAFALKKKVEELGGDCYFIKAQKTKTNKGSLVYLFLRYVDILKVVIKMVFSGKISNLFKSIKYKSAKERSFIKFRNFLELNKINNENLDLVIIGSDIVFNIIDYTNFNFINELNENIIIKNAKKIISYAASCGPTTLLEIEKYGLEHKMRDALIKFNAISVRDQNTFEVVKKISNIEPYIHIDPVFLYDFKDYLNLDFKENNYILLYAFQYKITKKEKDEIIKFAKDNNKKIISIGCYYDWCDKAILPKTPFEVLDYVKNADYVITDAFHGTVFSIKYNKIFCTLVRSNSKDKINHLLNLLGLEENRVYQVCDISKILKIQNNYTKINQLINKEIEKSTNYLSNFIK